MIEKMDDLEMDDDMTPREYTILLVSDDAALRATARHELETIDERRHVASVSTVDAARRIVQDSAPAVILLTETAASQEAGYPRAGAQSLDVAVSSLAIYAPVVVIGDAEHQTELSGLVAAGAADYVVRTGGFLTVALGLVERRLRKAQSEAQVLPAPEQRSIATRKDPFGRNGTRGFRRSAAPRIEQPAHRNPGQRGAFTLGDTPEKRRPFAAGRAAAPRNHRRACGSFARIGATPQPRMGIKPAPRPLAVAREERK